MRMQCLNCGKKQEHARFYAGWRCPECGTLRFAVDVTRWAEGEGDEPCPRLTERWRARGAAK